VIDWREVLDFEQTAPKGPTKARAIRERFGVSTTRYVQSLIAALDRPEALTYAPMLVARLRRLLAEQRRRRVAIPLSGPPPLLGEERRRDRVDFVIRLLAASGKPFTAEDVRRACGDLPGHRYDIWAQLGLAADAGLILPFGLELHEDVTDPFRAVWIGAYAEDEAL
jgi:hypothetical protein